MSIGVGPQLALEMRELRSKGAVLGSLDAILVAEKWLQARGVTGDSRGDTSPLRRRLKRFGWVNPWGINASRGPTPT